MSRPSEGHAATPVVAAAVRTRVFRLVLADHAARQAEARDPHLQIAVRLATAGAARATPAIPANFARGYVTGPGDRTLRVIERVIDAGEDGRYLLQVAATADVIARPGRAVRICARRDLPGCSRPRWSARRRSRCGSACVRCGELREGLIAIRRGEAERIAGDFPEDLAPLAAELNLLLDANREVVRRARTQVGNLAHALKTPLSVIVNEAEAGSRASPKRCASRREVMSRQVTFYLDRARAAARATRSARRPNSRPSSRACCAPSRRSIATATSNSQRACAGALRFAANAGSRRSRRQPARQRRQVGALAQSPSPPNATPRPTLGRSYFLVHIDDDGPGLDRDGARRRAGARPPARRIAAGLGARPLHRRGHRRQLRRRSGAWRQPARGIAGDAEAAGVLTVWTMLDALPTIDPLRIYFC